MDHSIFENILVPQRYPVITQVIGHEGSDLDPPTSNDL